MLNIIDANVSDSGLLEMPAVTAGTQIEQDLSEEIANLWSAHSEAKRTARATKEELSTIRAKLGEHLCQMKDVLARPGRDGQWSAFLRTCDIPRATGDRLVANHLRSLNPDLNCLTDTVSEPTEQEMMKYFNSILPRLRRFLKTPNAVYNFVAMLTSSYQCSEVTDRGILVLKPAIPTICPAPPDGECTTEPELGPALVPCADEEVI